MRRHNNAPCKYKIYCLDENIDPSCGCAPHESSGPGNPDLLLEDRRRREIITIECKCGAYEAPKELYKFLRDIDRKFKNFSRGKKAIVLPRIGSKIVEEFRRKGYEVYQCCTEPCGVCKICS